MCEQFGEKFNALREFCGMKKRPILWSECDQEALFLTSKGRSFHSYYPTN